MLYFLIFLAKTIETTLCTFRLIVVANGKKLFGAILNAIISIIWIFTAGIVIVKVKDIFRVFAFSFGCFFGSYLGSALEEKLAMGSNLLMAITTDPKGDNIMKTLNDHGFSCTYTKARGKGKIQNILFLMIPRKKRMEAIHSLQSLDKDIFIVSENIVKIQKQDNNGFSR